MEDAPIREARLSDVADILAMIKELAAYEKAEDLVVATEAMIAELLFGTSTPSGRPQAYCFVLDAAALGPSATVSAVCTDVEPGCIVDGECGQTEMKPVGGLAGFAFWFLNASTWRGTHGIYLEDLFVRPAFRGRGLGKALLDRLVRECDARGYERLQWWVLDWNLPAIEFYTRMGAKAMTEWTVFRIERPRPREA